MAFLQFSELTFAAWCCSVLQTALSLTCVCDVAGKCRPHPSVQVKGREPSTADQHVPAVSRRQDDALQVNVQFTQFKIFGLIPVTAPDSAKGSLNTTYLDEELRISRGDKGVSISFKQGKVLIDWLTLGNADMFMSAAGNVFCLVMDNPDVKP